MQAVVDVLDNMNESQERKDFLMGYLNRAQLTQRVFASTDGYAIVPDEEMKKLLITQAVIGKEGEKCFICYKCDDLTSLDNAKNVNMKEKLQCNHAIIADFLFANNEITDFDSTKNVVDVVKNDKKEMTEKEKVDQDKLLLRTQLEHATKHRQKVNASIAEIPAKFSF